MHNFVFPAMLKTETMEKEGESLHPFRHFLTVAKHRRLVRRYCFRLGLIRQGLTHDLSKYSPTEFWTGARYYLGDRSPNVAQREENGYSSAWMHHKGRNKHHFEYWVDLDPVPMPLNYVAEMVADRIAACRTYLGRDYYPGSELDYLMKREKPAVMHPQTYALLTELLTMLRDRGEDETFAYLRQLLREARRRK